MERDQDLSPTGVCKQGPLFERRDVMKGIALIACGTIAPTAHSITAHADTKRADEPSNTASGATVLARDDSAVVDTSAGKVAGFIRKGIFTFKGIPYGDTTEGANRFVPPIKPKPWSGVRSSRQYGQVAPQAARAGWANDEEAFMFSWDDGIQGEDCLRVNVWTPGINDRGRNGR